MKKLYFILLILSCFFTLQLTDAVPGPVGLSTAYADPETSSVPEACKVAENEFENVCYGINSTSHIKRVNALKKIKSCLKNEGFSDDKIKNTLMRIKKNANKKMSSELSQR